MRYTIVIKGVQRPGGPSLPRTVISWWVPRPVDMRLIGKYTV